MPEEDDERRSIFDRVLAIKKEIHFAVEGMTLHDDESHSHIENIWKVKKTLPRCNFFEE